LAEWCEEHDLTGVEPQMPQGIEDRAEDCWEPLLAIADVAGSDWPCRAREAAVFLTQRAVDDNSTKGVELLSHCQQAFGEDDRLATVVLLERLRDREESPWKDIRGKPVDDRGLASKLRRYGIKPKPIRIGERTPRGYAVEDFHDAWGRYLRPSSDERNKRNRRYKFDNNNNYVADVADVAATGGEGNDAFEERAAILQFDAGLSREEAEAQAALDYPDIPAFLDRRIRWP
jgi:Protein of unknown function (DUF3631)